MSHINVFFKISLANTLEFVHVFVLSVHFELLSDILEQDTSLEGRVCECFDVFFLVVIAKHDS